MVLIEAKVLDATHLELAEPIATREGLTVFIAVAEPGDEDAERQQWIAASAISLQSAYGESDPDYSASLVRETNPDYGK